MMRLFTMIAGLVLSLGASATAYDFKELPADLANAPVVAAYDGENAVIDCQEGPLTAPPTTPWGPLEAMPVERRGNAVIDLDLMSADSPEVIEMLGRVEATWNAGKHDEALALFPELETMTSLDGLGIGTRWIEPLQSSLDSKWGDDIQIGARDSVYATALTVDVATGNVFAILLHVGDGAVSRWTVNFSDNGGRTWVETYQYGSGTYLMPVIAAAAVDGYCFVGNSFNATTVSLRKFQGTDGANVDFQDGQNFHHAFDPSSNGGLVELEMTSNQDSWDNRLYIAAILDDGTAVMYWDTEIADSFQPSTVGATNAERGLSLCYNEGNSTYYMFASFIDDTDTLRIRGNDGGTWSQRWAYPVHGGGIPNVTSIGAYDDTVHCFFEYQPEDLSSAHSVYLVSYNGGTSFFHGVSYDTSGATSECPAVCARGGGGVGMVYRWYSAPREGRFVWRDYAGLWIDPPETYTDQQPYFNQPDIDYLGNDKFGVLFLSWDSQQGGKAYFDINTRCCTGPSVGNTDGSADNLITMGDLVTLIDHMFITFAPLECNEEGNTDESADGLVTMGDLVALIDHLFITFAPLPACP